MTRQERLQLVDRLAEDLKTELRRIVTHHPPGDASWWDVFDPLLPATGRLTQLPSVDRRRHLLEALNTTMRIGAVAIILAADCLDDSTRTMR